MCFLVHLFFYFATHHNFFSKKVSLLLNMPKCATVRALSYCELLALERSNLTKILKHFPEGNFTEFFY